MNVAYNNTTGMIEIITSSGHSYHIRKKDVEDVKLALSRVELGYTTPLDDILGIVEAESKSPLLDE